MKSWIKGGLYGLIIFIVFFIILSLVNTGKVSVTDAFGFKDGYSLFNYILVIIFISVGAIIGLIISKMKGKTR